MPGDTLRINTDVHSWDNGPHVGDGIHEMGMARMGRDPKTSVLNGKLQAPREIY